MHGAQITLRVALLLACIHLTVAARSLRSVRLPSPFGGRALRHEATQSHRCPQPCINSWPWIERCGPRRSVGSDNGADETLLQPTPSVRYHASVP